MMHDSEKHASALGKACVELVKDHPDDTFALITITDCYNDLSQEAKLALYAAVADYVAKSATESE